MCVVVISLIAIRNICNLFTLIEYLLQNARANSLYSIRKCVLSAFPSPSPPRYSFNYLSRGFFPPRYLPWNFTNGILYISSSCLLFIISIWMESFCSLSVHNNKSLTHSTYYRLYVRANYVRMVGILFGYCYRYGAKEHAVVFFFCQFIVAFFINRIVSISND